MGSPLQLPVYDKYTLKQEGMRGDLPLPVSAVGATGINPGFAAGRHEKNFSGRPGRCSDTSLTDKTGTNPCSSSVYARITGAIAGVPPFLQPLNATFITTV